MNKWLQIIRPITINNEDSQKWLLCYDFDFSKKRGRSGGGGGPNGQTFADMQERVIQRENVLLFNTLKISQNNLYDVTYSFGNLVKELRTVIGRLPVGYRSVTGRLPVGYRSLNGQLPVT